MTDGLRISISDIIVIDGKGIHTNFYRIVRFM